MTEAAQGAGEEHLAERALSPGQAISLGLRQPIVLILLLIAFFTTVTGKALDGLLMLTVATLLAWDAARVQPPAARQLAAPARQLAAPARPPGPAAAGRARRRLLGALSGFAAGLMYAGIAGSFRRYSWPGTISVVVVGCLAVAIGWQGPLRHRAALTGRALRRAWIWAVVLVSGGLWELSSLIQQPHLTTDSYAHPTISALTDPLLSSHPGRSLAVGGWLLIGYFLVGR